MPRICILMLKARTNIRGAGTGRFHLPEEEGKADSVDHIIGQLSGCYLRAQLVFCNIAA